jgi:hypothetical protein
MEFCNFCYANIGNTRLITSLTTLYASEPLPFTVLKGFTNGFCSIKATHLLLEGRSKFPKRYKPINPERTLRQRGQWELS